MDRIGDENALGCRHTTRIRLGHFCPTCLAALELFGLKLAIRRWFGRLSSR